jgi:sugar lactone lactonase YvrE
MSVKIVRLKNLFNLCRLMYWSDWSESQTSKTGKIERASMDGTGRQVFVDTNLKWPNGLSLDMAGKKLYWCDAYFNKIERINLDGSQREVLKICFSFCFGVLMWCIADDFGGK